MPSTADASAPSPLPELEEPTLVDPGLTDLSWRDWGAILVRAGKEAIDDKVPMVASALAYSSFLAIPSILLIALGLFTVFSSPETIRDLMDRLGTVMPTEATQLLGDSLTRLEARPATSISLVVVGFALALWGATGAMTVYMDALNTAFDRDDNRSFGRKRLVALALAGVLAVAVALVGVLLILVRSSRAGSGRRSASRPCSVGCGGDCSGRSSSRACWRCSRCSTTSRPTCRTAAGSS